MDPVTLGMARSDAAKRYTPLTTTNPQKYGAKGDTRLFTDGVTTAGSATFTSATAAFTQADVGKTIVVSACVAGAGTTLAGAVTAGATSLTTHAAPTFNSPYWIGTGAGAEQLTFKNLTGSSDPYSVFLTTSNTAQLFANSHSSGDPVVPMDILVTTVVSVQSATSVTLAVAPTLTQTARVAWLGTDDTAALQAMAAACTAGTRVELGPYNYLTTAAITFPLRVTIKGHGGLDKYLTSTTSIVSTSRTADGLSFGSSGGVAEDFSVINANLFSGVPTAGAGLHFADGAHSAVNRVFVVSFYDLLRYDDGDYYAITECGLFDPVHAGIACSTADGENFDHGDQIIQGSTISNRFVSYRGSIAAAVAWQSGGGLRFIGNKVNANEQPAFNVRTYCSKLNDGLQLAVRDGGSTSVLLVSGNSIENCDGSMIHVKQQAGGSSTGWFSKVNISGNEIAIGAGNGVFFDFVNGKGSVAYVGGNVFTDVGTSINAKNWNGLSIGPNMHNTITNVVNLQTGCLNATMERQTVIPNNVSLWQEAVYNPANNVSIGQNQMRFERDVPSTTSSSTYTALWNLTPAQNSAGLIELTLTGNVVGVGPYTVRARRSFTVATGAVTIATVDTDIAVGGLMDVAFDTATSSGKILVKVKLNTGGGTNIAGTAGLAVNGAFTNIRKGT